VNGWIRGSVFLALVFCLSCAGVVLHAQGNDPGTGLVAHEWGTFTSVAGADGHAVIWRPLDLSKLTFVENPRPGSAEIDYHSRELPSFVETLHFGVFKQSLPATIRMETPVLYFYSQRPMDVSVSVKFAKGLITEWYPHAAIPPKKGGLDDSVRYQKGESDGSIQWDRISLVPGWRKSFPLDTVDSGNRYYAARETSSTPLSVSLNGVEEHEKFLFYRGVSLAPVPVTVRFSGEGRLEVSNSLGDPLPAVIWFERRGDHVGYRLGGAVRTSLSLDPPVLTGSVEALLSDLEEILVSQGLFREEAHAMVSTWHDSWFEEGSRLFYIVPSSFVNSILSLTISPAPAQTVRVFVGRIEVISPATQKTVAAALAANDEATLGKYVRFLEPIRAMLDGKGTR
jgi:hypothetical protein